MRRNDAAALSKTDVLVVDSAAIEQLAASGENGGLRCNIRLGPFGPSVLRIEHNGALNLVFIDMVAGLLGSRIRLFADKQYGNAARRELFMKSIQLRDIRIADRAVR